MIFYEMNEASYVALCSSPLFLKSADGVFTRNSVQSLICNERILEHFHSRFPFTKIQKVDIT